MENDLTWKQCNAQLIGVQILDVFSQIIIEYPSNESLQHCFQFFVSSEITRSITSLHKIVNTIWRLCFTRIIYKLRVFANKRLWQHFCRLTTWLMRQKDLFPSYKETFYYSNWNSKPRIVVIRINVVTPCILCISTPLIAIRNQRIQISDVVRLNCWLRWIRESVESGTVIGQRRADFSVLSYIYVIFFDKSNTYTDLTIIGKVLRRLQFSFFNIINYHDFMIKWCFLLSIIPK